MLLPRTDSHDPDTNDADPRSTSSAPSVSRPALSFTTTADALASTPLSNTNPCAAYTWLPDTRNTAPPDATTRALAYNAYSPPNTAASSATPPPRSSSTAPSTTTVRPPVITVTRATPDTTSTDRTSRRPDSTSTGAYGEDCEPGRYTSGVGLVATSRESATVSTDPAGNVPVSTSAPFSDSTSHTDSSTGPPSSLRAASIAPRNAPPPITYSTAPFCSDTFCTTIRTPSRAIHGT
ncbi:mucin-2 precursor [Trypanosoma cruzi]|uniref:Mucin-2 n=1 Tax=Trypanosoma cruzi TaxID=5693 RepID=A0A7J6Y646_TRYCR|nr:mucin-2 precursor [Trypanosoma cruzi]